MTSAQKKAARTYRSRQTQRGIARFEIQALETDRELIRGLARYLAKNGDMANMVRKLLEQLGSGDVPNTGGILAALRRSPLVGADLDLARPRDQGRETNL